VGEPRHWHLNILAPTGAKKSAGSGRNVDPLELARFYQRLLGWTDEISYD
jgi:hypothetical protein